MAKKPRTKTPATSAPVPQSMEEANVSIDVIGTMQRERARIAADMNDRIAEAKAVADKLDAPLRAEIEGRKEGLETFCAAHREVLTRGGKVKFYAFTAGQVLWRNRPPKVTLRNVEEVLASLRAFGLDRFIRTKEEVDKEALLREPDVAGHVPGVTIGSEGEEFVVEPYEIALEEVA